MEKALSLEFLRVVEEAAIASARTMGLGDGHKSDQMAVETLRSAMDGVGMDGTIVIGEGERDKAPMLYIGEKVGAAVRDKSRKYPEVDIAVDPLEGTNLCATGESNAIVVLAASERGGLLHAPDLYMEKIIVARLVRELSGARRSRSAQSARNCQAAGSRHRRSRYHRARSPAPSEAHSGYSQDRRPHSINFRWRSIRRDQRGRAGHGSARRDGNRWRAGRCIDGRSPSLPQRANSCQAGGLRRRNITRDWNIWVSRMGTAFMIRRTLLRASGLYLRAPVSRAETC